MKIRNPFRPAPPIAAIDEPEATTRNGFFSTEANVGDRRLTLFHRQQKALAKTFQRGIEIMKPINPDGTPATDVDFAMDEAYPDLTQAKLINSYSGFLPIAQLEYFSNQGFIGWQLCAVLAQHWLIDKACGVPAQDAVRNGYNITQNDGETIDPKILNAIRLGDKRMNIKGHCREFVKKGRIFGVRHALFEIDGIDYELPFNPDGIKPGSYRGISQIDPYWIAPELDRQAAANPAARDFYEPTWWRVNGKRIHRSHFIIMRNGDDVVDILKPAYLYGGIPIPQKIVDRVYAADRTANEAPMLALSKRLTTLTTDTSKIFGPDSQFNAQMEKWAALQNNFGVKVIGSEELVQQFETSLASLDETIMTQYQLVSAACGVPSSKLLETSPKGFNATGEYEQANYRQELESIEENILTPLVERHHICMMRSYIAPKFNMAPIETEIEWKPTDMPTAKEEAEIQEIRSRAMGNLVTAGAIDGLDCRSALIADPLSGFNGIEAVVPGGPGDREAQQEADAALEQPIQASNKAKADTNAEDEAIAAGVVYRTPTGRFLMVRRADEDEPGGMWEFPAGHVEAGESAMQAASREFAEETGRKLKALFPLMVDGGFELFEAHGDEFVPQLSEHVAYVWAAADQLPSPLRRKVAEHIESICYGQSTVNPA